MHRGSQLADMFRGTPVERIIRPSKIPVLLAKETVRAPYSNVMVGVDFSVYSRRAVEFVVRFVPGGCFRLVQEGMVREVLQRQIGRQKPDLLVIGTHGRTGVAHAFLGSVAEELLREPPCDVLAVKAW